MYDYVVVGAGSAGCVLAARLSEDRDVRVGVIEAGPPDTEPVIHMPLAFRQLWDSRFDWGLWSEPEPGLAGRRGYLPRGRVLGGSSSLNCMIYMRGNRADYDEWAAMGLPGWGYEAVLPYFKRSEDNQRGASDYHGVGGPLTVSDSRSLHPLVGAVHRRGRGRRHRAHRRLQWPDAGGGGLVPGHPARRPALQHRGRLPAPGGGEWQRRGAHRRPGHTRPV